MQHNYLWKKAQKPKGCSLGNFFMKPAMTFFLRKLFLISPFYMCWKDRKNGKSTSNMKLDFSHHLCPRVGSAPAGCSGREYRFFSH